MKGYIMPTFVYSTPSVSAPVSFDVLYAKMLPHFRYFAKRLMRRMGRGITDFDDVIQELTGFALELYTSLVRRGKHDVIYYTPLMKYAIKRYREGRRFIGSNTTDILSHQTQILGRSDTCQLSQFGDKQDTWDFMTDRKGRVLDAVQFKIDHADWLQRQTSRDQQIIHDLMMGETTGNVARRYGVSDGLISQYRKRYADSWKTFITDKRELA